MSSMKDRFQVAEERAARLLREMSLEEKTGQLEQRLYGFRCYHRTETGYELTEEFKAEVERCRGLGCLYGLFRADPWSGADYRTGIPFEDRVLVANMVQRYVTEHSPHGIPVLISSEVCHGMQALDSTIFPVNLAVGASFDPELYERICRCAAREAAETGSHLLLSPCLDVCRDPRWGRTEECYGEDPCLSSRMTEALVRGFQADGRTGVVMKHFCGQGGAEGGRNLNVCSVGPRELREIHLPPAVAGVRAGALGMMAAYNEIDGIPCHANGPLLNGVMREDYGFKGIFMADGTAIDRLILLTGDYTEAAALALNSGVDVGLWDRAFSELGEAVRTGRVSEEVLDRAVLRVLTLKFYLGLMDEPLLPPPAFRKFSGRPLALKMAEESCVLVKNEGILPLRRSGRLLICGPLAEDFYALLGDYTPPMPEGHLMTMAEGIRLAFPDSEIEVEPGCRMRERDPALLRRACQAAERADAVILVLGGSSARDFTTLFSDTGAAVSGGEQMDCGEGVDLAEIELAPCQSELAEALAQRNKKVVAVLNEGRPYGIERVMKACGAVLISFYNGELTGEAVGELLAGKRSPSGRMPVSCPRNSAQLPVFYNARDIGIPADYADGKNRALIPFGFGLSYAELSYENLRVTHQETAAGILEGKVFCVAVDVVNRSDIEADDSVLLFLKDPVSSVSRRIRELKAFRRITLRPGEKRTVEFSLDFESFAVWSRNERWELEPGRFLLSVGSLQLSIDVV